MNETFDDQTEDLKVGDRVVTNKGKSGQIAYIGETSFAKGILVGLVLDECSGNHDGMYNGKRYFQVSMIFNKRMRRWQ